MAFVPFQSILAEPTPVGGATPGQDPTREVVDWFQSYYSAFLQAQVRIDNAVNGINYLTVNGTKAYNDLTPYQRLAYDSFVFLRDNAIRDQNALRLVYNAAAPYYKSILDANNLPRSI